jgi:hypothetical protein
MEYFLIAMRWTGLRLLEAADYLDPFGRTVEKLKVQIINISSYVSYCL